MNRKVKKKGFTLVEMLIVIAIIAALVAVIMPIFGTSTIKSAAATNAANLRSIKGQLTTMRTLYPKDFKTLLDDVGPVGGAISNTFVGILDAIYGEGYGESVLAGAYRTFTANGEGVMTLYAPNIVIDNVPAAKKMSVKGSNKSNSVVIADGTPMSVLITESDIIPYYGEYTIEHFADVAEDGKLDNHTIQPSYTGDGGILCDYLGHKFDAEGKCTRCPYDSGYHDHASADGDPRCDVCGTCIGGHIDSITSIMDWTPDGKCDNCGTPVGGTSTSHTHTYGNDHKCTVAGCLAREACSHSAFKDGGKCKCGGIIEYSWTGSTNKCPNC